MTDRETAKGVAKLLFMTDSLRRKHFQRQLFAANKKEVDLLRADFE